MCSAERRGLYLSNGGMPRGFNLGKVSKLGLLFAIVVAALVAAALLGWRQVSGEVSSRAQAEADRTVAAISEHLDEADKLFGHLARTEARSLRDQVAGFGAASISPGGDSGPPILKFGRESFNGRSTEVDDLADRMGGAAVIYVARDDRLLPVSTSLKNPDGKMALDAFLTSGTQAYSELRAGRSYTGPVEAQGRHYYGHLDPILKDGSGLVGAFGALYPLESVDRIVSDLSSSPVFAHGFLGVIDGRGEVLFRSSKIGDDWFVKRADIIAGQADPSGRVVDGYRLSRSVAGKSGERTIAGVFWFDLVLQTLALEGASLGAFGVVITLALLIAWTLAHRLTKALDDAHRSREQAELATAASESAREALAGELEKAAQYVRSLLPPPTSKGPVTANWLYRPSVGVGGDAFGYFWLNDTQFAVYLLDVCGHGVGAALMATTVMNAITTRTVKNADFRAPSSVLSSLNAAFPMDSHGGMYFTIWYGVFDTAASTLTFASAGHHPALLVPPLEAPQLLRGTGVPIGCFENAKYPVFTVDVPRGARLYVFSDGLFEIEPQAREEMFTLEEFCNIIMDWTEKYKDRSLDFVLETVQYLQGKANFDDDCALVEIQFNHSNAIEAAA